MHWTFLLSHWLTFTFALACLAVVDTAVPGWLYPTLVGVLTLLMFFPRRWHLNATLANLFGLMLMGLWLTWVGSEFYRQEIEGLAVGDDWLRVGFLRGGTLLALLLLAKWLRPRTAGDYWMMHALALVQVVLACATLIARPEDLGYRLFPGLLLAYLVSGVWALVVLHRWSETGSGDPAVRTSPRVWRFSSTGLTTAAWWSGLGVILAVILFLSVPRIGSRGVPAWWTGGTASVYLTGLSAGIDLTSGASLRLSDELVARMDALDAQGNRVWLGDHLRLRVLTCSVYDHGKWRPSSESDVTYIPFRYPIQLQGGQYRLQFQVDLTKLPSAVWLENSGELEELQTGTRLPLILAEPHPGLVRPGGIWFYSDAELAGVALRLREPSLWAALLAGSRLLRYEQLYDPHLPVPESHRESSVAVPPSVRPLFPPNVLPSFAVPGVSRQRLDELPAELLWSRRISQLAAKVLQRHRLPAEPIPGESADQVLAKAQILEHYLANNPDEFVYTLSRTRKNPELDPTEEFLLVPVTEDGKKAGWCQHYASALALLLRSQRIPARIVLGFRGTDWNPTWKTHEVRAYHAHAWVEALIGPRETDGTIRRGSWRMFDPTPGAAISTRLYRQAPWWKMLADDLRYLWDLVVLDGSTGQGFRSFGTVNALLDKLHLADVTDRELLWALGRALGGITLAGAAFVVWRRLRSRRDAPRTSLAGPIAPWQQALLQLLARILPPRSPAQSLLEYAAAAQSWLSQHGCPSSELARLPVRITELYYRYRFAQQPPAEQELSQLQQQLSHLRQFIEQLQPSPNAAGS